MAQRFEPVFELEDTPEGQYCQQDFNAGTSTSRRVPWVAWPMLVAAVCAVASAGVVFASLPEVPPLALAAWRLQLTGFLLLPFCVHQFRALAPDLRQRALQSVPLLLGSGACLAVHFGAWVWGIQHTSLAHSLLFVSAPPLVIAAGSLLLRKPISQGEVAGTCVGVLGAALLAVDAKSDGEVTLAGDLVSFAAAVAFVGYISVGSKLRSWMPIFVYACPVTVTGAVVLSVAAAATEGVSLAGVGPAGVFGWLLHPPYLLRILYIAVGPGIVGHTGFNTLLRWLSPLTISLSMTLEPLLGSLMGWALGIVPAPGAWTWAGGAVLLGAVAAVTVASHRREQREGGNGAGDGGKAVAEAELTLAILDGDYDDDAELVSVGAPLRG